MLKKFYKDNFKYTIGDTSYDYTENNHDEFFMEELSDDFNYVEIKYWDNYKDVFSFFVMHEVMKGANILIIINNINSRSWLFKHILDCFSVLKTKYKLNSAYKKYKYNVFEVYNKGSVVFTANTEDKHLPNDFDLVINTTNESKDVEPFLNGDIIKKEIILNKLTIINEYFRTDILGIKLQKLERITKSIVKYENPFTEFYILEKIFKEIKKT